MYECAEILHMPRSSLSHVFIKSLHYYKKIVQKFPQEQKKSISTKFDVEP